jgi:class 3 adenylate cyclase
MTSRAETPLHGHANSNAMSSSTTTRGQHDRDSSQGSTHVSDTHSQFNRVRTAVRDSLVRTDTSNSQSLSHSSASVSSGSTNSPPGSGSSSSAYHRHSDSLDRSRTKRSSLARSTLDRSRTNRSSLAASVLDRSRTKRSSLGVWGRDDTMRSESDIGSSQQQMNGWQRTGTDALLSNIVAQGRNASIGPNAASPTRNKTARMTLESNILRSPTSRTARFSTTYNRNNTGVTSASRATWRTERSDDSATTASSNGSQEREKEKDLSTFQRLRIIASYSPQAVSIPAILDKLHDDTRFHDTRKRFFGAVVLSDISGFTRLTEKLAQGANPAGDAMAASDSKTAGATSTAPSSTASSRKSKAATSKGLLQRTGANTLASIINEIFSRLISVIRKYGGDVIAFAGDALLSCWRPRGHTEHDEYMCCLIAAQATLEMQAQMPMTAQGVTLTLHSGISAGMLTEFNFGGHQGRYEYVIAGQPILEMGESVEHASSGQCVMHVNMLKRIREQCVVAPVDHPDFVHLQQVTAPPQHFPDLVAEMIYQLSDEERTEKEQLLSGYVPHPVMSALNAGKYSMIGDLRQVSILFINLPDFRYDEHIESDRDQQAFLAIQKALYRFDGNLRQLIQDDKGTVAIAAFGLPYRSHEDDPIRAVLTALAIRKALAEMNMRTGIGVTTGDAFCGSVGNEVRCEYAIVGDCVNLSARLMGKSKMNILCDADTHRHVATGRQRCRGISFEHMGKIKVKGKETLIEIFKPSAVVEIMQSVDIPVSRMFGRTDEFAQINRSIQETVSTRESSIILLEGEVGMGKTRLVQEVHAEAVGMSLPVLYGEASSAIHNSAYGLWRNIIPALVAQLPLPNKAPSSLGGGNFVAKSLHQRSHVPNLFGPKDHSPFMELPNVIAEDSNCDDESFQIPGTVQSASSRQSGHNNRPALEMPSSEELEQRLAMLGVQPHEYDFFLQLVTPSIIADDEILNQGNTDAQQQQQLHRVAEFVLRALQLFTLRHGAVMLIIEHLHHLDLHSWHILLSVCKNMNRGVVFLLTARFAARGDRMYRALCMMPRTQYLVLPSLQVEEIRAMCCHLLGISNMPRRLSALISRLSDGNPLFVKELVQSANPEKGSQNGDGDHDGDDDDDGNNAYGDDSYPGALSVAGGFTKGLRSAAAKLERLGDRKHSDTTSEQAKIDSLAELVNITPSIQQIMTTRIDQLSPHEQEMLKVASVVGLEFNVNVLVAVAPEQYGDEVVHTSLQNLERDGLIVISTSEEGRVGRFRHTTMQDVAYKVLSQEDRCQIHQRVAHYLESVHRDMLCMADAHTTLSFELMRIASRVAHHFEMAGKTLRAIFYYGRAADVANELKMHSEHIECLGKLMELALEDQNENSSSQAGLDFGLSLSRVTLCKWERRLAHTMLIYGQFDGVAEHIQQALSLLNLPQPPQLIENMENKEIEMTGTLIGTIDTVEEVDESQIRASLAQSYRPRGSIILSADSVCEFAGVYDERHLEWESSLAQADSLTNTVFRLLDNELRVDVVDAHRSAMAHDSGTGDGIDHIRRFTHAQVGTLVKQPDGDTVGWLSDTRSSEMKEYIITDELVESLEPEVLMEAIKLFDVFQQYALSQLDRVNIVYSGVSLAKLTRQFQRTIKVATHVALTQNAFGKANLIMSSIAMNKLDYSRILYKEGERLLTELRERMIQLMHRHDSDPDISDYQMELLALSRLMARSVDIDTTVGRWDTIDQQLLALFDIANAVMNVQDLLDVVHIAAVIHRLRNRMVQSTLLFNELHANAASYQSLSYTLRSLVGLAENNLLLGGRDDAVKYLLQCQHPVSHRLQSQWLHDIVQRTSGSSGEYMQFEQLITSSYTRRPTIDGGATSRRASHRRSGFGLFSFTEASGVKSTIRQSRKASHRGAPRTSNAGVNYLLRFPNGADNANTESKEKFSEELQFSDFVLHDVPVCIRLLTALAAALWREYSHQRRKFEADITATGKFVSNCISLDDCLIILEEAITLIRQTMPSYVLLEAYSFAMEVLQGIAENGRHSQPPDGKGGMPSTSATQGHIAGRMLEGLLQYFDSCRDCLPILLPRSLYWRGKYLWTLGAKDKAVEHYMRSLWVAGELQLHYDQGLAHAALAELTQEIKQGFFSRLFCSAPVELVQQYMDSDTYGYTGSSKWKKKHIEVASAIFTAGHYLHDLERIKPDKPRVTLSSLGVSIDQLSNRMKECHTKLQRAKTSIIGTMMSFESQANIRTNGTMIHGSIGIRNNAGTGASDSPKPATSVMKAPVGKANEIVQRRVQGVRRFLNQQAWRVQEIVRRRSSGKLVRSHSYDRDSKDVAQICASMDSAFKERAHSNHARVTDTPGKSRNMTLLHRRSASSESIVSTTNARRASNSSVISDGTMHWETLSATDAGRRQTLKLLDSVPVIDMDRLAAGEKSMDDRESSSSADLSSILPRNRGSLLSNRRSVIANAHRRGSDVSTTDSNSNEDRKSTTSLRRRESIRSSLRSSAGSFASSFGTFATVSSRPSNASSASLAEHPLLANYQWEIERLLSTLFVDGVNEHVLLQDQIDLLPKQVALNMLYDPNILRRNYKPEVIEGSVLVVSICSHNFHSNDLEDVAKAQFNLQQSFITSILDRAMRTDGRIVDLQASRGTIVWTSSKPHDIPSLCLQALRCAIKLCIDYTTSGLDDMYDIRFLISSGTMTGIQSYGVQNSALRYSVHGAPIAACYERCSELKSVPRSTEAEIMYIGDTADILNAPRRAKQRAMEKVADVKQAEMSAKPLQRVHSAKKRASLKRFGSFGSKTSLVAALDAEDDAEVAPDIDSAIVVPESDSLLSNPTGADGIVESSRPVPTALVEEVKSLLSAAANLPAYESCNNSMLVSRVADYENVDAFLQALLLYVPTLPEEGMNVDADLPSRHSMRIPTPLQFEFGTAQVASCIVVRLLPVSETADLPSMIEDVECELNMLCNTHSYLLAKVHPDGDGIMIEVLCPKLPTALSLAIRLASTLQTGAFMVGVGVCEGLTTVQSLSGDWSNRWIASGDLVDTAVGCASCAILELLYKCVQRKALLIKNHHAQNDMMDAPQSDVQLPGAGAQTAPKQQADSTFGLSIILAVDDGYEEAVAAGEEMEFESESVDIRRAIADVAAMQEAKAKELALAPDVGVNNASTLHGEIDAVNMLLGIGEGTRKSFASLRSAFALVRGACQSIFDSQQQVVRLLRRDPQPELEVTHIVQRSRELRFLQQLIPPTLLQDEQKTMVRLLSQSRDQALITEENEKDGGMVVDSRHASHVRHTSVEHGANSTDEDEYRRPNIVLLQGGEGTGRTQVLHLFEMQLKNCYKNILRFTLAPSSLERYDDWSCVRSFFKMLFACPVLQASVPHSRHHLLAAVRHLQPELVSFLPLFNQFSTFYFPETDQTSFLNAAARVEFTVRVLVTVFQLIIDTRATVIFVQALENMDQMSWKFFTRMAATFANKIVLSASPTVVGVHKDQSKSKHETQASLHFGRLSAVTPCNGGYDVQQRPHAMQIATFPDIDLDTAHPSQSETKEQQSREAHCLVLMEELRAMPTAAVLQLSTLEILPVCSAILMQLQVSEISTAIVQFVFDEAAGNLGRILELVGPMRMQSSKLNANHKRITDVQVAAGDQNLAMPQSRQEAFMQQLERLSQQQGSVLQLASILTTPFEADMLAALHPRNTAAVHDNFASLHLASFPSMQVNDILKQLIKLKLLTVITVVKAPAGVQRMKGDIPVPWYVCQFASNTAREWILSSTDKFFCTRLHSRLAQYIEAVYVHTSAVIDPVGDHQQMMANANLSDAVQSEVEMQKFAEQLATVLNVSNAMLAEHYQLAENPVKTFQHSLVAAQTLLNDPQQKLLALQWFQRSISLVNQLEQELQLLRHTNRSTTTNLEGTMSMLERFPLCRLHFQVAITHYWVGNVPSCVSQLRLALRHSHIRVPELGHSASLLHWMKGTMNATSPPVATDTERDHITEFAGVQDSASASQTSSDAAGAKSRPSSLQSGANYPMQSMPPKLQDHVNVVCNSPVIAGIGRGRLYEYLEMQHFDTASLIKLAGGEDVLLPSDFHLFVLDDLHTDTIDIDLDCKQLPDLQLEVAVQSLLLLSEADLNQGGSAMGEGVYAALAALQLALAHSPMVDMHTQRSSLSSSETVTMLDVAGSCGLVAAYCFLLGHEVWASMYYRCCVDIRNAFLKLKSESPVFDIQARLQRISRIEVWFVMSLHKWEELPDYPAEQLESMASVVNSRTAYLRRKSVISRVRRRKNIGKGTVIVAPSDRASIRKRTLQSLAHTGASSNIYDEGCATLKLAIVHHIGQLLEGNIRAAYVGFGDILELAAAHQLIDIQFACEHYIAYIMAHNGDIVGAAALLERSNSAQLTTDDSMRMLHHALLSFIALRSGKSADHAQSYMDDVWQLFASDEVHQWNVVLAFLVAMEFYHEALSRTWKTEQTIEDAEQDEHGNSTAAAASLIESSPADSQTGVVDLLKNFSMLNADIVADVIQEEEEEEEEQEAEEEHDDDDDDADDQEKEEEAGAHYIRSPSMARRRGSIDVAAISSVQQSNMEARALCMEHLSTLVRKLTEFAVRHPFARAVVCLYDGVLQCSDGNLVEAFELWHEATAISQKQYQILIAAKASYLLGTHSSVHDSARKRHLQRALDLFRSQLSPAAYDVCLTQEALCHFALSDLGPNLQRELGAASAHSFAMFEHINERGKAIRMPAGDVPLWERLTRSGHTLGHVFELHLKTYFATDSKQREQQVSQSTRLSNDLEQLSQCHLIAPDVCVQAASLIPPDVQSLRGGNCDDEHHH